MSGLSQALNDYLALRRGLGYKLQTADSLLSNFVHYVEEQGSSFVTTKLAVDWSILPTDASPTWKANRLCMVRGFAKYVHAFDSRTEIPSQELLPYMKRRPTPYLYSDKEIVELLNAARGFSRPLKARTYTTLLGLLAVTGMRIGEAINLDRADIDWGDKLLVVRESKFRKSRELLLHSTTIEALHAYARTRAQFFPRLHTPSFFVSRAGTRLISSKVSATFPALLRRAGLSDRGPRLPHIHDFRHTFAVKTLLGWYKAGVNVESRLPLLSTYLGHVSPTSTYWYLTATPELLHLAAKRRGPIPGELP